MLTELVELDSWFHCGQCKTTLFLKGEEGFELFFTENAGTCPECGSKVDLWRVLLDAVLNNFMLMGAFVAIGARTTAFSLDLKANETRELVFKELGVPEDASILSINYTPQGGGCFPIELHGNTPHWGPPRGGRVHLFGRSFPKTSDEPSEAPINCAVTWMKAPDEDDGWSHLLDAYRAYGDKNWRGVIIPANVAAESAISKAMFDLVRRFAGKKETEAFLSDGATYAHQLKVVLPMACALAGIPPLAAEIRGHLDRLRKFRNELAHTGSLDSPLEQQRVAELLVAATFGFRYGRFFRRMLNRQQEQDVDTTAKGGITEYTKVPY